MSVRSPGAGADELERLRREYETSRSWRLTRPLRAAGRLGQALRPRPPRLEGAVAPPDDRLDSWLEHFYGARLGELDAVIAAGSVREPFALFRELDDGLWAWLLTQQYDCYPNLRALLPDMPEPALQEVWNGCSGLPLAAQSSAFYARLRDSYERHGERPLADSSVLDFGCGWGRLTRYLARDVTPGRLYGCDPVQGILDVCRADRVPAIVAQSSFRPQRLPFEDRFDLAFAFSVFTHLSEVAHEHCLSALHHSLHPGGILVVTVRPPAYLDFCEPMRPLLAALGFDRQAALAAARYLFVPHAADPEHPQRDDSGGIDYGETVITMAYIQERWGPSFELIEVGLLPGDPYQVVLTLRRR